MFVTTKKALDHLEKCELSQEEHSRLLGILNKQIGTFPIKDAVVLSHDGGYLINGQTLTLEEVVRFRQEISNVRDNWAFKVLADQVLYLAIQQGVHFGETPEKIMFSKSVIYFIQKFKELLATYDIR